MGTTKRSRTVFDHIITEGATDWIAPANEHLSVKLGDNAGTYVFEWLNYSGTRVASINSLGVASFLGGLGTIGGMITFSPGVAVTAGSYQIGRDADATNQLHFNVPTGAGYEFSVNDVAVGKLGTTGIFQGLTYQPLTATSSILQGTFADGASAEGTVLDNSIALTTAGSKLTVFKNAGVEKAYIDYLGLPHFGKTTGNLDLFNITQSGNSITTTMRSTAGGNGTYMQSTVLLDGAISQVFGSNGTNTTLVLNSAVTTALPASGSAIALRTTTTLTDNTQKLVDIRNGGVSVHYIGINGSTNFIGAGTVTAANYQIMRNSDATNLMNFNVPAGAGYEFGINDVQSLGLTATIITTPSIQSQGSLNTKKSSETVADDGTIALPTGVAGFGLVQIGDNQERAQFSVAADGTVTLDWNSTNVVNTDTDANLCIYDGGTGAVIKNRLGSSLTVKYTFSY